MALLYKSVAFADSPLTLTALSLDALNSNQNSLVLDINSAGGAIAINLPSITSLMFGAGSTLNGSGTLVDNTFVGGGGMSFYINGNRTAGANTITFTAYNVNTANEVDQDTICGSATALVPAGTGASFQMFISGRHSWGFLSCVPLG